ncbi:MULTISPECIES: hypothetical protein [Providencia]|uniref:Uncharacterized protein n=5 Tax=Providencia stuartii TaxID=588 RepID=A0AAJ1N2N8_PROST|nr:MULTISPECIES: hypothetical protein [Providencia]EKX9073597.1 hypothetical protein [Proteus mirabilis]SST05361.1 Uncharacterised protein [Acinetobacter baumannii]AFH94774.1 hypothetical protein S70_14735 [Providencia stuartii MRSN 2154]AVE42375.1 hypothetical protein AM353_11360 [Providencia stuartii]EDU60631.1 hypothetical protein PROSTU_01165 [Providencia stuartii ATCC 25827]
MSNKIYYLKSDAMNYCSFIQDYPAREESIIARAMGQKWQKFNNTYTNIVLELRANDFGKKNYQFDFSSALSPFMVFSEGALVSLSDILSSRGQILPVKTESKRKKFVGYYPTNPLSECFDRKNSVYREYPNGLMIEKPVLIKSNITDEYLFTIDEDISRVFVTDKFKQRVEDAGLTAFDFSVEVELS